jgi:ribonuclease HI
VEAIGLLKATEWARDLRLLNMDFEIDSKTVVDNIDGKQIGVSNFSVIISNRVHLLCTYLINSNVSFIRRQANEVAHNLAKAALLKASFRIHSNTPSYIEFSIINEIH